MRNTKPFVAAAFICERILHEEDNVYSAIRIVDTYTIQLVKFGVQTNEQPPAPEPGEKVLDDTQLLNLSALVILKAGDVAGQHEVSLTIRAPGGKETAFPQKFPINFALGDPAEGAILTIRFVMPGTTAAGLYWIDVLWDGEPITSIPLKLVKALAPPATA